VKWLSGGVERAEVSPLVADTVESWAVLPPRPVSETCQAVFVVWSTGKLIASTFVPSVMTSALTASEPSTCRAAPVFGRFAYPKKKPSFVQKIRIDRFAWLRLCDSGGDSDHWSLSQEEKYNEVGSFEAALAAMQGAGQRVVSKRLIHPL
jgi:hypothetical protein